jgi:hypothetical protein
MSTILASLTLICLTLLAPARPIEPQHTARPKRIGFVWLNFPTTNATDVYDAERRYGLRKKLRNGGVT